MGLMFWRKVCQPKRSLLRYSRDGDDMFLIEICNVFCELSILTRAFIESYPI